MKLGQYMTAAPIGGAVTCEACLRSVARGDRYGAVPCAGCGGSHYPCLRCYLAGWVPNYCARMELGE